MSATAMQPTGQHVQMSSSAYPSSSPNPYTSPPTIDDESYYFRPDTQPDAQTSRQHRRNNTTQVISPSRNDYPDQYSGSAHHTTTTSIPFHTRNHSAPLDSYDGAPVAPTRSSSNQHNSPIATGTSRHARQNNDRQPGTNVNATGTYIDPTRERSRDDTSTSAASARSRRKGPSSPEGPQRAASASERGHQTGLPVQSRSEATMLAPSAPGVLVRENSEVINRLIVSDPMVDEIRIQERIAEAQPAAIGEASPTTGMDFMNESTEEPRQQRRQDYSKSSSRRKDVQFGDYVLGQTLGEGEFGKVKLGWKKDGSTQVAIKLIRRESVATNPSRLPKIEREIHILRDLAHPNIVRLHEMVETERHIGIILEYASGGELFDYILNQRYLKDPQARRLFAQLVSGVGYLHKKGIVHRDLKLENLLLDQNKNIIITDFGFANTFNPADELSSEIEYNLGNKDFVKKYKLDRLDAHGMRKGDLMQTSCGSPCYAAPELVVSDSLYTGRKVDVWSCGVILYAMLAGYLPFDDDPANPEGDNINLLYKYITTTPLTFPEYVSPHARDLLRRILVPDPRKRADLFEVARHSWLNEYHHVVAHITSSTTNIADIANSTVTSEVPEESYLPGRSASVREPKSTSPRPAQPASSPIIGQQEGTPKQRDRTARHTLQPEYVAPQTQTTRVTPEVAVATTQRIDGQTVNAVPVSLSKQLPPDPPKHSLDLGRQIPQSNIPASARTGRDVLDPGSVWVDLATVPRSISDNTGTMVATSAPQPTTFVMRPSTQGSLTSASNPVGVTTTRSDLRLPSRGSYGQPVAPTVAATNVQGKVTQPTKQGRGYNISGPVPQHGSHNSIGQPMTQAMPQAQQSDPKAHHRRSSTLSNLSERLFGRSNSVHKKDEARQKLGRKYPPTAMKDPYPNDPVQPRASMESKRSFSFGLKKRESTESNMNQNEEKSKRFSLIPSSLSFQGLMGNKHRSRDQLGESQSSQPSYTTSQYSNRPGTGQNYGSSGTDGQQDRRQHNFSRPPQAQHHRYQQSTGDVYGGTGIYNADMNQSMPHQHQHQRQDSQYDAVQYPDGFSSSRPSMQQTRPSKNVLVKPNRRFNDAYENDESHLGSSGAVKKVQDFFRRRGRARVDIG